MMKTLSLTQKYMLCTLGKKGRYSSFHMEKQICLVAAGVLELMMDDCIELEGKKLSVRAELPAGKRYLSSIYTLIQKKQPVKVETVIEHYSFAMSDKNINHLIEDIGESIAQEGCVRKEEGGLFGAKICYIPELDELDAVIQNIRAELLEDGALSEDIIALTALLNKCGEISKYFSPYEKQDMKKRLKEIKNSTENQVVTKMMDYIESLFVLIIVAAT